MWHYKGTIRKGNGYGSNYFVLNLMLGELSREANPTLLLQTEPGMPWMSLFELCCVALAQLPRYREQGKEWGVHTHAYFIFALTFCKGSGTEWDSQHWTNPAPSKANRDISIDRSQSGIKPILIPLKISRIRTWPRATYGAYLSTIHLAGRLR